jgi:hypothetical protein
MAISALGIDFDGLPLVTWKNMAISISTNAVNAKYIYSEI